MLSPKLVFLLVITPVLAASSYTDDRLNLLMNTLFEYSLKGFAFSFGILAFIGICYLLFKCLQKVFDKNSSNPDNYRPDGELIAFLASTSVNNSPGSPRQYVPRYY
jgi:hypothetical protein